MIIKSPKYTFVWKDFEKVLVGAGIAAGGAAVTYLLEALPGMDMGQYTYILIPVISILLNALRKYLTETVYK
jgi:hypothetical protein